MQIEAISAIETSTSALISNSVTSPMIASSTMGTPHRTMETQAKSMDSKKRGKQTVSDSFPQKNCVFPFQDIFENRSTALVKLLIVCSASPCSMPSRTQ